MTAYPNLLRLVEGATLALDVLVTDDLGSPVAWSAGQLTATIADLLGNVVASPVVTPAATQGWGTITTATVGWPIGRLAAQLTLTAQGEIFLSDAFFLTMERPVA